MGLLINGQWHDQWYDTASTGGRFVRKDAQFRGEIAEGGAHPPAAGRYHLYVAMACPWAHRTLLVRTLFGLEDVIGVSSVHSDMLEEGWTFTGGHRDALYGSRLMHEIYTRAAPTYTGRVTVPVLWDREAGGIVNNESSEIIRMMYGPMARLGRPDAPLAGHDLRPAHLADEIDRINADIYDNLNNGVYKAGFATTQAAYDEAVEALFACMTRIEDRLSRASWLCGDHLTEADLRLWTTAVRFDPVYHFHFKCSRRRLRDHPNLWSHTRAIAQLPGVAATIDMPSIRRHYFYSHEGINPHRVVPVAPEIDLWSPHDRGRIRPDG
ncbi:MAG: glutathione S-transferase family protein [Myxococcota bacterium]|nr:glutathione S-transferase family protein [Myxococcota bacterium]